MISAEALSTIRTVAYGAAGIVCAGYALAALLSPAPETLPHWAPLTAGIFIAIVIFASAFVAGPANTAASLDESYREDQRTAAVFGFWGAIGCGVALWLLDLGGAMQLAITMTFSSGVFLLAHVVLELRGRM